jgi:hypothetical protein
MSTPPGATVAFVSTHIEGSTRLLQRLGDEVRVRMGLSTRSWRAGSTRLIVKLAFF